MSGKKHIDDVRFAIARGELNIEIVSGRKTYEYCITVGQARPIAAEAIAVMDKWIAGRRDPARIACAGH
jgi:hypothetical protein